MRLSGKHYTRADYLRHVGLDTQAFGIRAMEYRTGDANLVKTFEVDTGAGLTFSVNENKGMDIFRMSYRGVNLGFISKAGLHSPYNVNPESDAFRYTQGCGMLYTAGVSNVGAAGADEKGLHCAHGNLKNSAAVNVCAAGEWQNDEYEMLLSGEMREASFYGRNLVSKRTIRTRAGSKSIFMEDLIENRDFEEDQVMLLYHLNAGFPFLSEGVRFYAPVDSISGATPRSVEMLGEYDVASAPKDGKEEYVYTLQMKSNANGMSGSALWNDDLQIGLYIRFDTRVLNRFVEWKCMRSGDYAMGMLAANCYPFGRAYAAQNEAWTRLKPFEKIKTHLEIGVLEGTGELKDFQSWLDCL